MRQEAMQKTLKEKDEEIRQLKNRLERKEEEQNRLKKLASFPELNPNAIVEVNISGEIRYINPAAKGLFPDLAEKGINHPYLGDWEKLAAFMKDKAGISINREVKMDSTWYSQSICINNGESIRIYGFDITERKKAEEALRRSEEKYRSLFESMDEGFVLCEMIYDTAGIPVDFRYLEVNSAFARLTGLPAEQVVGRTVNELTPGIRPFWIGAYSRILQTGIGERIDNFMPELGRHYESFAWRTGDRQFAVVFNDITERKKTEEALKSSEEKFRTLFENAPIGIGITSLDGRAIDRNKAAADMYGFKSVEEMLKSPVTYRYAHSEDRDRFYELLDKGLAKDVEVEMKRTDGSTFWVSLSSIPYVSGFGEKQTISTVQDITKRKKAEEEIKKYHNHLEELVKERTSELEKANSELKREMKIREKAEKALRVSEEKLRIILDNLPLSVTLASETGDILERNRAGLAMFGFDNIEELQATPFEKTYYDIKERNQLWQQIAEGPVYNYEVRRKRKDGSIFWTSTTIVPYPDDPARRRITVIQDITERKGAEEALQMQARELAMANVELTAVNKELESFSYSVSHDLRAPLRGIDGFSQILLEEYGDKFNGESKDYLLRVRQASQRMGMLIDDLLSLSRVTRSEMSEQVVDMSSQAESIINELRKAQPNRLVDVIIEPGLTVKSDAHLLNIMLVNLLGNAWKFTGKHAKAKIEFGKMNRDGEEVFFVRDDGAGFDMAYVGKLFQPFQRLHGTSEFEGTGIGLATVQRVINRHGGVVWAEGAVEKGAVFYFFLPQK